LNEKSYRLKFGTEMEDGPHLHPDKGGLQWGEFGSALQPSRTLCVYGGDCGGRAVFASLWALFHYLRSTQCHCYCTRECCTADCFISRFGH